MTADPPSSTWDGHRGGAPRRVAGGVATLGGQGVDASAPVARALGAEIDRRSSRDLPVGARVAVAPAVYRLGGSRTDAPAGRCGVVRGRPLDAGRYTHH